jgi:integrase
MYIVLVLGKIWGLCGGFVMNKKKQVNSPSARANYTTRNGIYERNGRFQVRIQVDGQSANKTFTTKTDAEAYQRKVRSDIERGRWHDNVLAEGTTVAEALTRYLEEVVVHKRGARQEESIIGIFLDEPVSRLVMARVRSSDVWGLVSKWRKSYAPATIHRRLSVLRHMFEVARKSWGMDGLQNPVTSVELPKIHNTRERRVSDDELEAICDAFSRSPAMPVVIRLAVETGMRRGEIASMRWRYVDLVRRAIHIPSTKNGHPRDVPLSSRAVEVLRDWREVNPHAIEMDTVFGIRPDSITQAFDRAVTRVARTLPSVNNLRFHDLRHEATSRLASLLSVHELAKVTGHRELRMLMRYYHPTVEDLAAKLG